MTDIAACGKGEDKAGEAYWTGLWKDRPLPKSVLHDDPIISEHFTRAWKALFKQALEGVPAGSTLLEIGCSGSPWLPYCHHAHGLRVRGLDYSEIGCEQARAVLARDKAPGEVVCADFFAPPPELRGSHDAVISIGVVEHFTDTAGCLRAFAEFLRPGGVMLTIIPNLSGLLGMLQKRLNRPVYDLHVILNREKLAAAHRDAGLTVVSCEYFMFANSGVLVPCGPKDRPSRRWLMQRFQNRLGGMTEFLWAREERGWRLPPNVFTSPYVVCVARKPAPAA
jgi:2-polyprenyl-3-methyl-5-hydroxy-6-metoxy-1,4-benzoquinol methylase